MELKPQEVAPEVRVLMTATCASLTGKSKLTYDIGCAPDAAICLRITANSGNGAFNQEWVTLGRIKEVLTGAPAGEITSFTLRPAFVGKSANNASFMLAVLQSEGLLRPSPKKRRCHELADEAAFATAIAGWNSPDGKARAGTPPKAKGKRGSGSGPAQRKAAGANPPAAHQGIDAPASVADDSLATKSTDASKQKRRGGAKEVAPSGAIQSGSSKAAQDETKVAMAAIPSFSAIEPAHNRATAAPRTSKAKKLS